MKPWQKSNYMHPTTSKATVSVEVEAVPPPPEEIEIEKEEYKCPVCGRIFSKKVALANHLRAHKRRGEYE